MHNITPFINKAIVFILKNAGFTHASSQSIDLLVRVYEDRLLSICKTLASATLQGNRTKTTLFDLIQQEGEMRPMNVIKLLANSSINRQTSRDIEEINNILSNDHSIELTFEEFTDTFEWISPLSNRVDKFIHIYDFMPEFPPIHTFRQTPLNVKSSQTESLNVKNRMDQSLKSEGNMFKLFKSSGSLPSVINYLYKRQ